ncbi:serine hydrolase domain-containing protein [Sphingobacterium corticibacterium]|uniref:Class C beta-lactamase-related serine hydrolase n=1 Tax=Sphingobacterium corticibacterium TaxID=2484746 RepID=A0A4V2DCI2_9SPHI|nr:serine hydrolase [Sphingobacterium corticibacterium]RZF61578.1 class C beta-lactamase-related serine hydrolase [Sphingobacterium corticibacterium]
MKSTAKIICFMLLCVLLFQSCKLGRFVFYNFANITDHKIFPYRTIETTSSPFTFPAAQQPKPLKGIETAEGNVYFDTYLEHTKTVAFLVIQNDSIQYEKYFNKYDDESIVASFSMAKSVLSMLIGIAIKDGKIQSADDPITNYIPELKRNGFDAVTIKHLLQMTSGLDFNESYTNPFGHAATFYYGTNLRKAINKLKLKDIPGEKFNYTSGTTQLLGLVLERALENQTISSYLEEKIWKPLGMEYEATWSLDRKKDGLEKTFCCLNARARDFAKLGRLYLHNGNWNGKQIVPEQWVKESIRLDTADHSAPFYQYQWWLTKNAKQFYAKGILGQYIFVDPHKHLIIVRLGEKTSKVNWDKFITQIADSY